MVEGPVVVVPSNTDVVVFVEVVFNVVVVVVFVVVGP